MFARCLFNSALLLAVSALPLSAAEKSPASGHASDVAAPRVTMHPAAIIPTTAVFNMTTAATLLYGQVVDGFAQVNASDQSLLTGTITFYDGTTNLCVVAVTANLTCPDSAGMGFAAGLHSLTAAYSGDATHAAVTSNAISFTVLPSPTTAVLASSVNPAPLHQPVTLTATLSAGYATPSGAVTFTENTPAGNIILGTGTLNAGGVATLVTSSLSTGNHNITASYAATQNFKSSSSVAINQAITATTPTLAPTAVMISSTANPAVVGQAVQLTANVVTLISPAATPTGAVVFLENNGATSTVLGTATLDASGLATLTTSTLGLGTHVLTASYAGDNTSASSLSSTFNQVVSSAAVPAPVSFTIGVNSATVATGQSVNLLVKVVPLNGFSQPVQLSCANLPTSASCTFATTTVPAGGGTTAVQVTTLAPRACGSSTAYGQTATSLTTPIFAAPALAGLLFFLLPFRRRSLKTLLALIGMAGFLGISGCGACTDLGTRPGTYTFQVIGTSIGSSQVTVTQQVQINVTP